jgi:hypothetical protein
VAIITRRYIAQVLPVGAGRLITIDVYSDESVTESKSMANVQEFARKRLRAKSIRITQATILWKKGWKHGEEADYVIGPKAKKQRIPNPLKPKLLKLCNLQASCQDAIAYVAHQRDCARQLHDAAECTCIRSDIAGLEAKLAEKLGS